MFGNLLKAVVGVAVETPISAVADIFTIGGLITDKEKPYTAEALEKVMENLQKSTESNQ